ncbi:MAG: sigma-70 family RNA polymerase sigma factor [Acidobacteriaceae bacterium]|nr:sigma-70 family RNA polymerase sigma factor [Acidobacteriaceae bacterium]
MSAAAKASDAFRGSRDDETLVRECLNGNGQAWSALIDKYKNLIFSIPIKYGFSPEDANEIFQSTCLTLLNELSQVREPRALAAWLIRATAHKCKRYRRDQRKYIDSPIDENLSDETEKLPEKLWQELEREQILREVVDEQSPECRQLIDLLFFANPPLRYDEAAQALQMAKGSIGATRMRCLEKLRRALEKKGFADY